MADAGEKTEKQLREITECPICMNVYINPRILPCIHTFCFECLTRTSEATQKKPGDKMPCPLCRKEYIIPVDGVNGVQKNFFMENLLEFKTALQIGSSTIICNMCNIRNDGETGEIPKATMRCLECQDYYCDRCVKVHQVQKLSRDHQIVKIGNDMNSEIKRFVSIKFCTKHIHKPLDYYCAECKKVVCVSCFVESHKLHDCKDVTTVDEEFRQTIKRKALTISTYMNEMMSMRNDIETRKADLLSEIVLTEKDIYKRNMELKDMIDRHTQSLLDELSVIKSKHLKEMETKMEEIDRSSTLLGSFEAYCTQLTLTGSASDICSSFDQIIAKANNLESNHNTYNCFPYKSVEVFFQSTDLSDILQNANSDLMGTISESTSQYEHFAVVEVYFENSTGMGISQDVVKINLHKPNEIIAQEEIPAIMATESVTAVYENTMYVTGIGDKDDEIWRYNKSLGWEQCASFLQGRIGHSAAFINEVLYICGGSLRYTEVVLDSVEAFNAVSNKCTAVGKLVHGVRSTGNCVPYRSSLYIFGGLDKDDNDVDYVQLYNTKENICTLISKPMPMPCSMMRAAHWETYVILVGYENCFIFDIETGTWQTRKEFKTNVPEFGLVVENERVFVIGSGNWIAYNDGNDILTCRDDVRYVPLQNILDDKPIHWKILGKFPKPSFYILLQTCAF